MPDLTISDSIGPHDSLQAAIDAAADGGTIYLDPGIYTEHDIVITKNINIRSNAAAGGNRYNTIIDAQEQGRIFSVPGTYSLSLDSLTLRNATLDGGGTPVLEGGAILADSGSTISITSVSFIDCSVTGTMEAGGGAICSYGLLTITSSSFEDCSVYGTLSSIGGAILGMPTTTVTASSFKNCRATGPASGGHGLGGAIGIVGSIVSSSFEDCTAAGETTAGGAVFYVDSVVSSSFRNCSAEGSASGGIGSGGAIFYISTVTSCTFYNCSVTGYDADGGAIGSLDTVITSSSFTNCAASAPASEGYASGGAIYVPDGMMLTVTSTRFTGCTATGHVAFGGAIYNAATVSLSSFDHCAATGSTPMDSFAYGGGIYSPLPDSPVDVTTSSFTDCSVTGYEALGGAIFSAGSIASSTFTRCTATGYGGAIFLMGGNSAGITSSSFTVCSAASGGGAIATLPAVLTITSSSFERCAAGSDGGGAILSFASTSVHFSRFYQNTATGSGPAIRFVSGTIDANNNWWGTNSGPGTSFYGPSAAVASWLVLGITADPSSISLPQTSFIRTNLTYTSDGTNTAGGGIYLPNAIPNMYAVTSGPGIVAPVTYGTVNGGAQTTYITLQSGTPTIAGTVDGQTVYITLDVAQGTWTPAPTETPIDDDWPQVGTGASGGGGGSATTGASAFPLMTVTVNIGGDSKAWQAVVTGTKLSDLIVTGTVQSGASSNCSAPPGVVFQYINLVPARYETITNAVIHFTVPQSWLDENHIDQKNIILYRQTANCWEALPTTVLYTKDGTVYLSAQSSGFSLFAIAGTPTVPTPPVAAPAPEIMSTPVREQTPAPAPSVKVPVTMQTTTPPATSAKPAAPSPLLNIVLVIAAIGVLAGGGFMARRWWIRRQNPALFEEF